MSKNKTKFEVFISKSVSVQLWGDIPLYMGREHASRDKKLPMVNFLIFGQMNIDIKGFQKMKIRPWQGFEKIRKKYIFCQKKSVYCQKNTYFVKKKERYISSQVQSCFCFHTQALANCFNRSHAIGKCSVWITTIKKY